MKLNRPAYGLIVLALLSLRAQAQQEQQTPPPPPPPQVTEEQAGGQPPQQPTPEALQFLQKQLEAAQAQFTASNPNTKKNIIEACEKDSRISVQKALQDEKKSFLFRAPTRAPELLLRAAVVVKNRYSDHVQPQFALGRLVEAPICASMVTAQRANVNPNLLNFQQNGDLLSYKSCLFAFETHTQPAGSPLSPLRTVLAADLHINLRFDPASQDRPGSALRPTTVKPARFDVELDSEPFVFDGRPNIAPLISLTTVRNTGTPDPSNLDTIDGVARFGVVNAGENRLKIATRMIERHEAGLLLPGTIHDFTDFEIKKFAAVGQDPCGETPVVPIPPNPSIQVACYSYSIRAVNDLRDTRTADGHFIGQLKIYYQTDVTGRKILGVRGYSFGANI